MTVLFVGAGEMRALNRRYRGKDYATDVLSFRYADSSEDGRNFLGEIVVAPSVAATNAGRFNTSAEKETRRLLVHGVLHLLGYDHESDGGEMMSLQNRLLRRRLFLASDPVLARR